MNNKWYVVGIGVPAVGFAALTVWCLATQNWLFAGATGLLAAGLVRGCVWAWRADPFASVQRRQQGDVGTSVAVARWHQHCDERDAAAKVKAADTARAARVQEKA